MPAIRPPHSPASSVSVGNLAKFPQYSPADAARDSGATRSLPISFPEIALGDGEMQVVLAIGVLNGGGRLLQAGEPRSIRRNRLGCRSFNRFGSLGVRQAQTEGLAVRMAEA